MTEAKRLKITDFLQQFSKATLKKSYKNTHWCYFHCLNQSTDIVNAVVLSVVIYQLLQTSGFGISYIPHLETVYAYDKVFIIHIIFTTGLQLPQSNSVTFHELPLFSSFPSLYQPNQV